MSLTWDMGWKMNVHSCTNILSPMWMKKWSSIVCQIHRYIWVHSWMNHGNVEDKDEYQITKYLLEKFICCKPVLDAADDHMFLIVNIIKFLRNLMYIWETFYLHYICKLWGIPTTPLICQHTKALIAVWKATVLEWRLQLMWIYQQRHWITNNSIRVAECDE